MRLNIDPLHISLYSSFLYIRSSIHYARLKVEKVPVLPCVEPVGTGKTPQVSTLCLRPANENDLDVDEELYRKCTKMYAKDITLDFALNVLDYHPGKVQISLYNNYLRCITCITVEIINATNINRSLEIERYANLLYYVVSYVCMLIIFPHRHQFSHVQGSDPTTPSPVTENDTLPTITNELIDLLSDNKDISDSVFEAGNDLVFLVKYLCILEALTNSVRRTNLVEMDSACQDLGLISHENNTRIAKLRELVIEEIYGYILLRIAILTLFYFMFVWPYLLGSSKKHLSLTHIMYVKHKFLVIRKGNVDVRNQQTELKVLKCL